MSSPKKSGKKASKKSGGKGSTRSAKAGLTLPVARIGGMMRKAGYARRFSRDAPVAAAGALEYLTNEIINAAASAAKTAGKKRITPRTINMGVNAPNETNLGNLFAGAVVSGGGVSPHIDKALTQKRKKSKKGKKKAKKEKKPKAPKKPKAKKPKKKSAKKSKKKSAKKSKSPKK